MSVDYHDDGNNDNNEFVYLRIYEENAARL